MATTQEVIDAISENAVGPQSVTADGISVTQHSIEDQKKALAIAAADSAAALPAFGLRFTVLKPGGCG